MMAKSLACQAGIHVLASSHGGCLDGWMVIFWKRMMRAHLGCRKKLMIGSNKWMSFQSKSSSFWLKRLLLKANQICPGLLMWRKEMGHRFIVCCDSGPRPCRDLVWWLIVVKLLTVTLYGVRSGFLKRAMAV